MGVSEACYLPAALAKIAEHHGNATRSLAVGLHQSGLYVGMIAGGAVGGYAAQFYGWRAPFLVLGVIGVVYCLAVFGFFRREIAAERGARGGRSDFVESAVELWRLSGFRALTAVFGAVGIANWLVYTWLPVYLYERFHMTLAEAGFTATFYIQAASFAGIFAGGWGADRLSAKVHRARLYTQVAGLTLASPFLFLLGRADSHAVLIAALVLFGMGRGFYEANTMPVLCQIARDDLRSTGYGIFNFAGCMAGGVMAALAGALKSAIGLSAAFTIAAAILCASAILLIRVRIPLKDQVQA
jgi:predicted MFS family arabinose efflux permease